MSLFCRHNRFMAECPICSKGTVLDPNRRASRPRSSGSAAGRKPGGARRPGSAVTAARVSRGVYASAGPYDGGREVRFEKVPGGLRLAAWEAGSLAKEAPVLALADLPGLLDEAAEKGVFPPGAGEPALADAAIGEHGASPGRTGELQEELRVERLDERRLRIARWILRPGRGWELQETPVMLPAERFAGALRAAAGRGVLAPA